MSETQAPPQDLLEIASALLPAVDLSGALLARGQFHDVVLVPDVAAVRVARRQSAAAELPRRMELLRRLGAAHLPFLVPEPLTSVTQFGDRAAVAVTWIAGRPLPKGAGSPAALAQLLAGLRNVDPGSLGEVLGPAHAYAGGERWYDLMINEAIPRLPTRLQDEARQRVEDAAALPEVEAHLVHGDLGGHNLHWDQEGRLIGVLDWDLAQPFDQAVDVACLGQQGWDNVRLAVDNETFKRAQIWYRTFGVEQIVAAITNGEPDDILTWYVNRASRWLDTPDPF